MKKIGSLILAVMILMMTFVVVPVSAAFSADNISVNVNVYNITVTVTSESSGTMTAKLTNESGNVLYGMKSDRTPTKDSAVYTYEFSFRMRANVPTAKYTVTVGNNVPLTSKTFPYVRLGDKIDFYDTLNVKSAGEIKAFFAENPSLVPVDLTEYNALAPDYADVLALVNKKIAELNLATGIVNTDTDAQKEEKISAVDLLFATEFDAIMKVAKMAAISEANWETSVAEKFANKSFDNYFYTKEKAELVALDAADVYDNFVKEVALVTDFSTDAYADAFDKATLTEIAQTKSWGVLREAFLYYEGTKSIAPDMTYIKPLVDAGQDADLWKALKEKSNPDSVTLIANAEAIAKTMEVTNPGDDTIGGTSTPVDTPTGGSGGTLGGGGGGGSSEPQKPTEPETPVVPAGKFNDIKNVEWAKESIEALAEKGIINGKGDGKFAPNDSVTREEFVKIIIGAFELNDKDAKAEFSDVDTSRWSYTFIATANSLGIVTGDGKTFNPTGAMSRQDMAVVIWRTAEKLGVKFSGDAIDFSDADDISDYAKNAIESLTAAGVINGMGDGTFAPKSTVTRAQAAKVIYGLMVLCGGGK